MGNAGFISSTVVSDGVPVPFQKSFHSTGGGVVECMDLKSPNPKLQTLLCNWLSGSVQALSGAVDCGVGVSQACGGCFVFNVQGPAPSAKPGTREARAAGPKDSMKARLG